MSITHAPIIELDRPPVIVDFDTDLGAVSFLVGDVVEAPRQALDDLSVHNVAPEAAVHTKGLKDFGGHVLGMYHLWKLGSRNVSKGRN